MNINNGKTGNVNIPGPLHSTGGDGDGQIGGVVAYAGDVYDETLGKNQKEINQTLLNGSANSNVIASSLNDLNEKVEEQEKVTSSGLNDLNDKTDNLGKDIENLEKTASTSLNDLNEKVDNLNEKVDDNEKVTATALTDLDEKTDINEKSTSVALNDLNDKIDNLNDKINDRDIVGLKSNIVVDLSTRYSTSYANLSTALTTLNNDTATDAAAIKKGGVSVKFINSSTNKYEQWNLKASSWSTNTSDWALDVDGVVPSSADSSQHDFSIEDENGNVILSIDGDRLKAGSFDSDTIPSSADSSQHDFSIEDENGNAILWVDGGYVKTKRFDSSNIEGGSYLPYARRTYFQYPVDCSYIFTSAEEVGINTTISQQVYLDNAILYLPANYDPKGKPVKLVIYCKHGASMLEPNSDPIADNFDGNIMRYLLSLGYAVLGADGIPNQFASAIGLCERVVGNYIAVQSAIRAFQTVCKNYNVDGKRVFLYGYSQGGMYAQNLLDLSKINFACAALISPVCSMRYHQWDLAASGTINGVSYTRLARLNIARLFDYPAVANNTELLALEYDQSKLQGYDPWTRNAEDVYTGFTQTSPYANNLWALPQDVDIDSITMRKHLATPIKVWCAKNDNMLGADVMRVLVKAVKNAGCVADIKLYASGAHQIQSNQNSIGTYSENGETKNLYPLAKEVAMWYYQFGGYSLT